MYISAYRRSFAAMLAELITIGDEILIGQIVDTNSAWMGEQLNLIGVKVKQISSVSDDPVHICKALDEAQLRADIILITGGLGPTKDDLTKKTLCEYFGMGWRTDEPTREHVSAIFKRFGREASAINLRQADVPDGCTVLHNANGTAPGMWFEKKSKVIVSMPGVPYEMKKIMQDEVLPRLQKKFQLPFIYHRTVLTQGIGESILAERMESWENSLAELDIKLAYLPSAGMVRLRLSTSGDEENVRKAVDQKVDELLPLINDHFYGFDGDKLAAIIGQLLRERKKTLSTAESCTGGAIAKLITEIPGCSDYFLGSTIAYSNVIKVSQLGISEQLIKQYGAVSREVVEDMARHSRIRLHSDYSIAVSGIAGPGGGSAEKPVGTIWIAAAGADTIQSRKLQLGGDRIRNIEMASLSALMLLRNVLLDENRTGI
jgi:nicotinamide-nucleotide amidase